MCATLGLSIDDLGMSRDTVFQEIRPGAGFETGDFVKEKLGGLYIVERLTTREKLGNPSLAKVLSFK